MKNRLKLKVRLDVVIYSSGAVDADGIHYGDTTHIANFLKRLARVQHERKYLDFITAGGQEV